MAKNFSERIRVTTGGTSLPTASNLVLGGVKVDGNTIIINDGVISISSTGLTNATISTSLTIPSGDTASRPTATQGNLRFNTTLRKFEGYSGITWGSIGGGLIPTAILTANDGYIVKANDLVRCNTTGGAFAITLPSAPNDGDIIGVVDTHRTFNTNNLTVLAAGSNKIEGDAISLILDMNAASISLVYNLVNTNWRVLETPTGTGTYTTPIKINNGYVASVNDLVRCNTTSGPFSVTLPASPADGSIVNFVDVASAGSFLANNLTVLSGSGNTVNATTSLLLGVNGTYTSLVYNSAGTNWKILQTPSGNVTTLVPLTGLTIGTGNNLTNAIAGTHFVAPSGALGTPTSGTLTNCTVNGTDGIGYINIPQNSKSTPYTLVLADAGKHIFHPSNDTTARTFTIPANSSVPYPIGTAISFVNMTAEVVSIEITADTMYLSSAGTTGTRSLARYGSATAIKITDTEWLISGSGLA